MARFVVPNNASIHTLHAFLRKNPKFFYRGRDSAILEFHPKWAHMEPIALAMAGAWGAWCRRKGISIKTENLKRYTEYAARMKLFDHLDIPYDPEFEEHEEAGRFLPITQVQKKSQVAGVIGDISALLHLQDDPESLAAVQYCISELLRNVLEHSGSADGAFVCAHRYTGKKSKSDKAVRRVTIAVADCGSGIAKHLGQVHPEASTNDVAALGLAMRPGITGAQRGMYGTQENAGAGLFITRCIAKGTGGYFALISGAAAYRQKRTDDDDERTHLYGDPFDENRHDRWQLDGGWQGTAVTVEIRTDEIADYQGFFRWIFDQIPKRTTKRRRIQFQ